MDGLIHLNHSHRARSSPIGHRRSTWTWLTTLLVLIPMQSSALATPGEDILPVPMDATLSDNGIRPMFRNSPEGEGPPGGAAGALASRAAFCDVPTWYIGDEWTWSRDMRVDGDSGMYMDESEDFTSGPGNLVHMTTGMAWRDEVAEGYKYYYKITAVDFSGNESDAASAGTVTGDDTPTAPKAFALHQNVPNPFNPTTVIQYEVPKAGGYVTLRIYDVTGRLVKTLVDGIEKASRKSVLWDGRDARGARAASGVYFYRLEAPGYVMTRKMVLLK